MFKASSDYFSQVSDDTIIWRYMSFDRFLSIIEKESLFFTKVTTYDDDPFEGSYNKVSKDDFVQWMIDEMAPGNTIETVSKQIRQKIDYNLESMLMLNERFKSLILVNCWHINDYESVAMWKLYSSYEKGVAIRTTYGKLKQSFERSSEEIFGGAIRYIDIKRTLSPLDTHLPLLHQKELVFRTKENSAL